MRRNPLFSKCHRRALLIAWGFFAAVFFFIAFFPLHTWGRDLPEVLARGELLHLGLPYANFISGAGDGFSVDLVKGFAAFLEVTYRFVPATKDSILQDLLGREVFLDESGVSLGAPVPVRGDLIAMGFTILPWREEILAFSNPTFISQVWLLARSDISADPIAPSGNLEEDIRRTREKMRGLVVLGMNMTGMDPALYCLKECGARFVYFEGNLNDLAPAVLAGEADATLLDVPDSLMALAKWPGKVKVIGPISTFQYMAGAFRKDSPALLKAFNEYLDTIRAEGTYKELVERYYPGMARCFPVFFERP
jgi:ABC-type amino acid transport substrate-binding protein